MYTRFEQLSHYVNDAELAIDNNALWSVLYAHYPEPEKLPLLRDHTMRHILLLYFSLYWCV